MTLLNDSLSNKSDSHFINNKSKSIPTFLQYEYDDIRKNFKNRLDENDIADALATITGNKLEKYNF